jgi:hypothetical protein
MTPKEKAKELVDKMYMLDDPNGNYPMCFDIAKECALVAVDEMILVLPFTNTNYSLNEYAIHLQKYLEQVKQEIETI